MQPQRNNNINSNISPIGRGNDIHDRISGITNSGDIVRVRDSNYVITEDAQAAEFTQFGRQINSANKSPLGQLGNTNGD